MLGLIIEVGMVLPRNPEEVVDREAVAALPSPACVEVPTCRIRQVAPRWIANEENGPTALNWVTDRLQYAQGGTSSHRTADSDEPADNAATALRYGVGGRAQGELDQQVRYREGTEV